MNYAGYVKFFFQWGMVSAGVTGVPAAGGGPTRWFDTVGKIPYSDLVYQISED